MQNMRIGIDESMRPVAVKSSTPERLPSWKTQTIAPKVAVRLSRLSTSALIGISTLPVIRNSSTRVAMAMMANAHGRRDRRASLVSSQLGGAAADQRVETGVEGADVLDELLAGAGLEIDARHDLEQAAPSLRVPGRARRGLAHHVAVLIDAAGALDAGDAVDRRHVGGVGGQRGRIVGPLHHDRERLGAVALELGLDPLGHLPGVGRLRQDPLVGQADRQTQERRAEQDQQRRHPQGDRQRSPHDGGGDTVPEPVRPLGDHGGRPPGPARVDPMAEHREQRGQGDDRGRASPGRPPRCRRRRTTAGSRAGRSAAPTTTRRRSAR